MDKLESKTIVVKVKDLVPYARDPRRNDQAVDHEVAEFYKAFFDDLQPFNEGFEDWKPWR